MKHLKCVPTLQDHELELLEADIVLELLAVVLILLFGLLAVRVRHRVTLLLLALRRPRRPAAAVRQEGLDGKIGEMARLP